MFIGGGVGLPNMFIGGMLDSPTHDALTSRSHTVLTRASDSSHELLDWLYARQRELLVRSTSRPTVATRAPARARLAFASRYAFHRLGAT